MVRSVAAFAALVVAATRVGAQQPPAYTPGIRPDSADTLAGQARAAFDEGSADSQVRALRLFLRSAELYGRRNAHDQQAEALAYAARIHGDLGRPDSALTYYHRALGSLRQGHDRTLEATVLTLVGQTYHGMGALDSALAYYGGALALTRDAGDREGEGRVLNNIGIALNSLGRADSALNYLGRALLIRRAIKDRLGEGVTLNNLARVDPL